MRKIDQHNWDKKIFLIAIIATRVNFSYQIKNLQDIPIEILT